MWIVKERIDTYLGRLRRGRQTGRQAGRQEGKQPVLVGGCGGGGLKAGNGGKGIGSWSTFN